MISGLSKFPSPAILIVDSVLKRKIFSKQEKMILLVNAHVCWVLYWLLANWLFSTRKLWGFHYYSFNIPDAVIYGAIYVTAISTALVLFMLARKWINSGEAPPINGTVGYLATLYAWLLFGRLDLLLFLVVPTFHSLQYLVVVARYRWNLDQARPGGADKPRLGIPDLFTPSKAALRFTGFAALGLALGYLGFRLAPRAFEAVIPYDPAVFNKWLFFFAIWIFINVHHYFLDNVIWRRESPDTGKHLFAHCR